ncbi:heavy metal sensor histidine kinase [Aliivibrio fischeri]|uniref:heavy metal sensor histidine kinase n=1 Tax=Aliivibrio fischeri TaxID=668 RepID=UPI001F4209F2|nr:heavy metal sensor histidine kinase [Aliivibrio fischeri]MCE7577265.1 heavy metal sensor histidine kinase [Aliivibrio fischeri]MCE7589554.1 heavy metal sensor histidine kinase [Aliivibrio fischeri]
MKKHYLSMKLKLTLMFFSTSVFVFIGLGFAIQYLVQSHFYEEDLRLINANRTSIFVLLENEGITSSEIFASLKSRGINIWIANDNGTLTQNTNVIPNDSAFKQSKKINEWTYAGSTFRTLYYPLENENNYTGLLIGINIDHHIEFNKRLKGILIWSISIASLLSFICSFIIVNMGFKPLQYLQDRIKQVQPNKLSIRLSDEHLPNELVELAKIQNRMLDRLELGFERLSDFSSDIAHELKTPLSNIMTQTHVTLSQPRTPHEYQEILSSNLEELERINKTINDTLYLAKSENDLLLKDNMQLDLEQLFAPIIEYYSIVSEETGVTIHLSGNGSLWGDKSMIQRVANNLLSNAIRHSAPDSDIQIKIEENQSNIVLSISNIGDEIPDKDLPFIFERFYRADKSRQHSSSTGAGLGLTIVRSIVNLHNGDISVQSEGKKTTFLLTFPL